MIVVVFVVAVFVVAVFVVILKIPYDREFEFQRVELGIYRYQITVTDRPPNVLRALGASPRVQVFLMEQLVRRYEHVGWVSAETFNDLSSSGTLAHAIKAHIRKEELASA